MKKCIILFILTILTSSSYLPQYIPSSHKEAEKIYFKGHKVFSNKDYDIALKYYSLVKKFIKKNPWSQRNFDHYWRGVSITELVKNVKPWVR